MASIPPLSVAVTFGPFQLDPATGEFKKHGIRVRLARQPCQILMILIQRSGEVVTREQIREQIWSADTFVDFEHGLNAAINKLRQALGDSADKPRFIKTLSGRGYRFLVPVQPVDAVPVPAPESPAERLAPARRPRGYVVALGMCGVLVSGGLAAILWMTPRHQSPVQQLTPVKFTVAAPEGFALEPAANRQAFAISPDGSRLAFTALGEDGRYRLWRRDFSEVEARELPAAQGTRTVFWSPDSQSLFWNVGRSLRRIAVGGGGSFQIIGDFPQPMQRPGVWIAPDRILFSDRPATFVLPATGGTATRTEQTYMWPQMLPDGKHILYLAYDDRIGRYRLRIAPFGQLQAAVDILETDSRATYVPSTQTAGGGYLLYVRAGRLLAQPFDAGRFRITGDATPLAGDVHFFQATGGADFSVSQTGTLVYQPLLPRSRIRWLDPSGRELTRAGTADITVKCVRSSPDGLKIAAAIYNLEKGATEIWVFDTVSKAARVVIPGPGILDSPIWSADSTRLLYARGLGGAPKLYVRDLGQGDREEALPVAPFQLATDWSRDGRFVLYTNTGSTPSANESEGDVSVIDLHSGRVTPLLDSPSQETNAVFSPDVRWVAFVSNDSGQAEAYVQAFQSGDAPRLTGERMRASSAGALYVRWRGDGKEIYYLGLDGLLYAVPVAGSSRVRLGPPSSLFRISAASRGVLPTMFGFDVSADGRRFLVSTVNESRSSRLVVVQNWESLIPHK